MLYSHYEGFCRTAFLIYVDAINKAKVLRKAANDYIVACSFAEEFQAYEDASRKPEIYRKILEINYLTIQNYILMPVKWILFLICILF